MNLTSMQKVKKKNVKCGRKGTKSQDRLNVKS